MVTNFRFYDFHKKTIHLVGLSSNIVELISSVALNNGDAVPELAVTQTLGNLIAEGIRTGFCGWHHILYCHVTGRFSTLLNFPKICCTVSWAWFQNVTNADNFCNMVSKNYITLLVSKNYCNILPIIVAKRIVIKILNYIIRLFVQGLYKWAHVSINCEQSSSFFFVHDWKISKSSSSKPTHRTNPWLRLGHRLVPVLQPAVSGMIL